MAKRSRRVEAHGFNEISEFFQGDDRPWQERRDRDVEERFRPAPRRPTLPLTDRHRAYQRAVETHDITMCVGPAGTGKTSLACEVAVRLFRAGAVTKIVLTRPLVQCDEELGILPGELGEKMAPYLAPLVECLRELLGAKDYSLLEAQGVIEVCPLAVMRGKTFHNAFVILDEGQNATYGQLRMFLTRAGHGSKFVVAGDITQADIAHSGDLPLFEVVERLKGHPDIAIVRMRREDVLRPELVQWVDERLTSA